MTRWWDASCRMFLYSEMAVVAHAACAIKPNTPIRIEEARAMGKVSAWRAKRRRRAAGIRHRTL